LEQPSLTGAAPRSEAAVLEGRALGHRSPAAVARDVLDLTKPGITTFVVFSATMGLWLAPASIGAARSLIFLLATGMLVSAANILNCFLEREIDARMHRTRNRPLPAGRLDPWAALALGIWLAAFALPMLAIFTSKLTALVGLAALVTYTLVYTPLKRVTPRALEIGTIPGALPTLMGWSAATGEIAAPAWALFGILVFWQLPHFLGIAIYSKEDYARGGIRVLPLVRGEAVARVWLFVYTVGLVAVSLTPVLLGIAGRFYLATALVAGTGFLYFAAQGLRRDAGPGTARKAFLYSLIYLPVVLATLVLNAV
jgi:protoheme IX farnesyltransferase